jgi:hypothetical protein
VSRRVLSLPVGVKRKEFYTSFATAVRALHTHFPQVGGLIMTSLLPYAAFFPSRPLPTSPRKRAGLREDVEPTPRRPHERTELRTNHDSPTSVFETECRRRGRRDLLTSPAWSRNAPSLRQTCRRLETTSDDDTSAPGFQRRIHSQKDGKEWPLVSRTRRTPLRRRLAPAPEWGRRHTDSSR